MLPVLWHHPFVCFDITHLDEKWLADLTQTLMDALGLPPKSPSGLANLRCGLTNASCVALSNQALSHVKKFRGRSRTDAAFGETVRGGAMPPPLRGLEAHSCRSNSESTLLHGEDDSLNPILSVEPFHSLLDVPIDGSV